MKIDDALKSDPRNRPIPHTFFPPKPNRLVSRICKMTTVPNIKRKLKVEEIEISDNDLATLRDLRGKRCLLMPSHSGGFEPYLIVYLSKLLNDDYFYLAAIEAFQRNRFIGWIMQRMGSYSIIRGSADRPSFIMTKKILVDGKRWLVIFPEGQTVWQNDTVIPFQEGVTQLAFKALEDIPPDSGNPELYCIPIAVKYSYLEDMNAEIEASLHRLESAFFTDPPSRGISNYERLKNIGMAMLTANEKKHGITQDETLDFNQRIQNMKQAVVRDIEKKLRLTPRPGQNLLDRIRSCFYRLDCIVSAAEPESEYERKLDREYRELVRPLYHDLWRVLQLVAIYDGYVTEHMSVERFMDVLCLLEMEVFEERRMWGPRKAVIKIGTPINLRDKYDDYRANKRNIIRKTTLELEGAVRNMLSEMAKEYSTPMSQ